MIEEVLLALCCQQIEHVHVDEHLAVAVGLPGVILQHVQHPACQVQHTLIRTVLQRRKTALVSLIYMTKQDLSQDLGMSPWSLTMV